MHFSLFSELCETQYANVKKDHSPTRKSLLESWNCIEETCQSFRSWDDGSAGSNQLPSLGLSDCLPDILEVDHWEFPVSEIETIEGINDLTSTIIQYLLKVKDGQGASVIRELLHVLTILEHLGLSGELSETSRCHLDNNLMRILMKVNSITLSEATLKRVPLKNPYLHASIFTWKVGYKVYSAVESLTKEARDRRISILNELLVIINIGLIKIFENYRSIVPCSCVQSIVFLLFSDQEKKCEEVFVKSFQSLRRLGKIEVASDAHFKVRTPPTVMSFFKYYMSLTEYLLQVHRLKKDGEKTSCFLLRIFGMSEQLISFDLVHISKLLVNFLDKNDPGCLTRLKMISKKFWVEIVKYLEQYPIRELESVAVENPSRWSNLVLNKFRDSQTDDTDLLRLLSILLADKILWENTRTLIKNHFASRKISFNPLSCGTILSLIMSICANQNVAKELSEAENIPAWLLDAVHSGNSMIINIAFNANDILSELYKANGLQYMKERIAAKLINSIPLPSCSTIYLEKILSFSPYRKIEDIDFNRIDLLPQDEFVLAVEGYVDADWMLSQKVWNRANTLMDANRGSLELKRFVFNQFRAGLQENLPFFNSKLASFVERYSKDPCHTEVLQFCTRILEPGRSYNLNLDQFIPLWISSVVAFSDIHEHDLREFTYSIWKGICFIFQKNSGNLIETSTEPSWEHPINYVIKMFSNLKYTPNRNWAIQKLNQWFPPTLASSLQILVRKKESDEITQQRRNRALTIVAALLKYCAPLLYTISELNEPKQSFNGSTLVITVCTVTDKDVLQKHYEVLYQNITGIVSGLVEIPETVKRAIFIRSRLKEILLHFSKDQLIRELLLTLVAAKNYVQQLKRDSVQIVNLFDSL